MPQEAVPGGSRQLGGPGYDIVEKVRDTLARRSLLPQDEEHPLVVVAVSGGPDSTCLLDVLARLPGIPDLVVAHVDHGLSEESAAVAARVARDGAVAGFDVHVARASALPGPNLQERARNFRYSFFESIAAEVGATRIATGHTLDDRVETTFARLIHGSGTDGLAGIPPHEGPRIRPLIDLRRAETRSYCLARGLGFYDDPANEDHGFERVAIRTRLMAAIEERWGPGAIRAAAGSADRLSEDAAALARTAEALYAATAETGGDGVSFPLRAMLDLPRAFRRRMLEQAVGRVRDRSGGIEAALEALEVVAAAGGRVPRELTFAVASGPQIRIDSERVVVLGPSGEADGRTE